MSDREDLAEKRTEEAGFRSGAAEDRTLMANERTFAGWLRTALAALAVAIGLHAVFRDVAPSWIPRAVATVFVLAAIAIVLSAARKARKTHRRFSGDRAGLHSDSGFVLIAAAVTAGSAATGVILWLI
ncbi:YidH family protein [Rhodosalinus sp.]|uniref:YidH family protein n=1 Tax=Rhodosalinus sp. TaxID=2047741 RepID=UPI00397B93DA